jgi:hypothetical protein
VETKEESKPVRKSGGERAVSIAFASTVILAVAIVSFLPGNDKHLLHTRGRYHSWGHLLAFSVIGFGVARLAHTLRGRVLLLIGSLFLGLAIEYGEHLVFGNPLEWKDVVADGLGVMCGTLLAILISHEGWGRG